MRTLIPLLFAISIWTLNAQTITVNAGLDSVTNKKQKAELTGLLFNGKGELAHVTYIIRKYEANNTTLATASGSETKRALLEAKEYNFTIGNKFINTTTKAIAEDSTLAVHVKLRTYLSTKAINTYPGVVNAAQLKILIEGVLREVINMKQASGQLPQ